MLDRVAGPLTINRAHPLNRGRRAWWLALPGRNYGGARWLDLVGTNHGVLTNMASGATSGWSGTARPGGRAQLRFDGADDYVYSPLAGIVGPPVTFLGWGLCNAVANFTTVYGCTDATGMLLTSNNTGNPLSYQWQQTSDEYGAASGLALAIGAWNFCAVTITPTYATVYQGVAGGPLRSWTNTKAHSSHTLSDGAIGDDARHIPGRKWTGALDDVSVYARSFSDAEMAGYFRLSQAGHPGPLRRAGAGPVGAASGPAKAPPRILAGNLVLDAWWLE